MQLGEADRRQTWATKALGDMITAICKNCSSAFQTYPSAVARGRSFCSQACSVQFKTLDELPRFERYVEKVPGACWRWLGAKTRSWGYGAFNRSPPNRMRVSASRAAWELYRGPIPTGMLVCHHCDNPPCCNPDHLFLGTSADNSADMKLKGRHVKAPQIGSKNGCAILSETDVYAIRGSTMKVQELMSQYGVSRSTIYGIRRREIWGHLQ